MCGRLADLQRLRGAGGDRDAGGHHAVRAEHADREVGDVHRAALALVVAGGAAEQLAHHRRRIGALGQRVAVAAVGGGEQVVALQVDAHAGGHGLLAGRQVQRPAHQRRLGRGRQAPGRHAALAGDFGRVFEGADAAHQAVQLERALQGRAPRRPDRGAADRAATSRRGLDSWWPNSRFQWRRTRPRIALVGYASVQHVIRTPRVPASGGRVA